MTEMREHDDRCDHDVQLQPDLVVLPKDRSAPDRTPVLVVEVLSPSASATDRTLKRLVFEQGGIPSYRLVDPLAPSLTVLELREGSYVEAAVVKGGEGYQASLPFPVEVVPVDLLQ